MTPKFWKLSQGTEYFTYDALLDSISDRVVYVHRDTKAKAVSSRTQAQDFIETPIGDYFYLTYGNAGIYVLGQLSGPANVFSTKGEGWLDRPFRHIKSSVTREVYTGPHKWWTPQDNSTFTRVPEGELKVFEESILRPYFGISLAAFGME